jgi:hypothetical protein
VRKVVWTLLRDALYVHKPTRITIRSKSGDVTIDTKNVDNIDPKEIERLVKDLKESEKSKNESVPAY